MKVRCYAIYLNQQEIMSEYCNPSQRVSLHYDLAEAVKRSPTDDNIKQQQTNNGVWYSKLSPIGTPSNHQDKHLHLVLLESPSIQTASSLLNKGIDLESSKTALEKVKMKMGEQMRIINANTKIDNLNSNVMELE